MPFKDWDDVLEQVKRDLALPKGVTVRAMPKRGPVVHVYGKHITKRRGATDQRKPHPTLGRLR